MIFENKSYRLFATDLSNHLSCEHLTQLNRLVALGEIKKPSWRDPSLDVLIQRGQEHEAAYLDHLKKKGLRTITLGDRRLQSTIDAMSEGNDAIAQGYLEVEQWSGITDILLKVPGKSKFGDWQYEVQDTKLSQNTKASAILQLCLYTELLATIQGVAPERMWIVKPGVDFPSEEYRFAEFQAYYNQVKRHLLASVGNDDLKTYPDKSEHCSICNWWKLCDQKRHDDDHLSLVAGMRSLHIVELQRQNINTLEQFAKVELLQKPERGNRESFARKQWQAKVQLEGRYQNKLLHDFLPIEIKRGLNLLPEPNEGDIYFDLEGDAFFPDGGLEYVFGYAYKVNDNLEYICEWSTNRGEERQAFERFMQFVLARWRRYPKMHIYHFAPYEPSAIKRLARVHAAYEKEVDDLLYEEVFVDLYAIFKEALIASVERYSLKELEKFTTYTRKIELHDASVSRKSVEVALELGDFKSLPKATIQKVREYNEDDCLATSALHHWLEGLRIELIASGKEFQRPVVTPSEKNEKREQQDIRTLAIFKSLIVGLPEDRATWNNEHQAKWLLAHQIDYFRREDKSAWWEHFRLHNLEYDDIMDERKAIGGLQLIGELPKDKGEKNVTHRYSFPPQEVGVDEDDDLFEVKGPKFDKVGSVKAISKEQHIIDIKKTAKTTHVHPAAVHVLDRIDPGTLLTAILDVANVVVDDGLSHVGPYHVSKDLLVKRDPKLFDGTFGAFVLPNEDIVDAAIRIALNLDRSYLAIQGPPGSGKTYTGARMIIELLKAGKKIGITAVSHKVIRNLSLAVIKQAKKLDYKLGIIHKVKEPSEECPEEIVEVFGTPGSEKVIAGLSQGNVGCGTAWLWTEDKAIGALDYLFVDEAGQMSLTQTLAASRAARNIILLGDPQQLEQPQKGAHPEGSDVAALTYLLDGHRTMPVGRGLFLGITRRLHPDICAFTSEIFYESKLHSLAGLEKQMVSGNTQFDGSGLFYVPVNHKGNQNISKEEVDAIEEIVSQLLATGKWTNDKGETQPIQKKDILIVAPFNAQVGALREKLPGIEIGTVDKFQGQEAAVVIYSMTSSTVDDAPRGMSFLFSPNRLNVATSRARCICILVASPALLHAECRTIEQMRWANALCRYAELAKIPG
jgi:predicted RecB family nuclease